MWSSARCPGPGSGLWELHEWRKQDKRSGGWLWTGDSSQTEGRQEQGNTPHNPALRIQQPLGHMLIRVFPPQDNKMNLVDYVVLYYLRNFDTVRYYEPNSS